MCGLIGSICLLAEGRLWLGKTFGGGGTTEARGYSEDKGTLCREEAEGGSGAGSPGRGQVLQNEAASGY